MSPTTQQSSEPAIATPELETILPPSPKHEKRAQPHRTRLCHNKSWRTRIRRGASCALLGAMSVTSALGLTGCGNGDHSADRVNGPPPTEQDAPEHPTTTTTTTTTTTLPPPSPEELAAMRFNATLAAGQRIEYAHDFPDPYVLRDGDRTYFYATNAHWANVPVLDERALLEGALPRDALPTENLGAWATPNVGHVWGPSVTKLPDGRYAMFYSGLQKANGLMAIGVAYADNPMGPFRDPNAAPLITAHGGAIDATVFRENDRVFVVFKNDGNSSGSETAIWLQEFAGGGMIGAPAKLLGDAGHEPWEEANYTRPRALIEGPSLVREGGRYYLFFSANAWDSPNYAVSYAVSDSLTGPFQRAGGRWMASSPGINGPGGQEIFRGPEGKPFIAYHAWGDRVGAQNGGERRLIIDPLTIDGAGPHHP